MYYIVAKYLPALKVKNVLLEQNNNPFFREKLPYERHILFRRQFEKEKTTLRLKGTGTDSKVNFVTNGKLPHLCKSYVPVLKPTVSLRFHRRHSRRVFPPSQYFFSCNTLSTKCHTISASQNNHSTQ